MASSEESRQRVLKFVSEWRRLIDRGDEIYSLHVGDDEREAVLLASDLEALASE